MNLIETDLYFKHINAVCDKFAAMTLPEHASSFILEQYGLHKYLWYFQQHSSSHDLPYHNRYHTRCMIVNCYEGARFSGHGEYLRSLLVAALMHDADHSGGLLSDDWNIANALMFFERAHVHVLQDSSTLGLSHKPLTVDEYQIAREIIKITKYPYESEPVTVLQEIIRDADLMQFYEGNPVQLLKQFQGLKAELEIAQCRKYTADEWARGVYEFQSNVRWYTNWAVKKAEVLDADRAKRYLRDILRKG